MKTANIRFNKETEMFFIAETGEVFSSLYATEKRADKIAETVVIW